MAGGVPVRSGPTLEPPSDASRTNVSTERGFGLTDSVRSGATTCGSDGAEDMDDRRSGVLDPLNAPEARFGLNGSGGSSTGSGNVVLSTDARVLGAATDARAAGAGSSLAGASSSPARRLAAASASASRWSSLSLAPMSNRWSDRPGCVERRSLAYSFL